MNFDLNEEQSAFQQMAANFSKDELEPCAAEWDENSYFPLEVMRRGAALGLAGLYVSPKYGGAGLGRLDGTIIFEELSKGCTSTAAFLTIHNMVARLIEQNGSEGIKDRFLSKLCSMELVASYCLTEPGSGSDAASLTTKAERTRDGYVLNGTKAFISGGGVSDVYVVMVRTGESGASGISCVLVEKGTPGLSFGANERKMGWKSQPTAQVVFEDCHIPLANLVGQEGQGFKIAMQGLDGGRLNIGACSLGAAEACLSQSLQYMQERKQFGKTLSQFQALQFKLADMTTELEAARLLLRKAASLVDRKDASATKMVAMAKLLATDTGFKVVNDALQLHGGYGYLKDYPLERYLRDVRVHQILEGTNEVMRLIIARELLK
ncbi:acyl-CoA dehydrogenase family protein [Flexibacterium corallicola]|uniref:acyl-CoA dehydrogenase family protein n=1 Tax=Flexibacterium corallicola TaxID=3037259 RepID=UPI00286EE7BD|nr:acyl-CoA dehydrogenase family protein [Pseudovibrio sp. M1P-2-3]